jgi:hypothetical protein
MSERSFSEARQMSIARPHHQFSVADYEQMIDLGILTENDRVELIRGEIVEKMSIGEFTQLASEG